jgi:hypothetical protein
MTRTHTILFIVAAVLTALVLHAQENDPSYPATRTWKIILPPGFYDVQVVETAGVCLYIGRTGEGSSIAAVPKTQLPPGKGCQ